MTTDEKLDRAIEFGKKMLNMNGECHPMFHCYANDGKEYVLVVHWKDNKAKREAYHKLSLAFLTLGINSFTFTAESWALEAKTPKEADEYVRSGKSLEDTPGRCEIIMALHVSHGEKKSRAVQIVRDLGSVSYKEWKLAQGVEIEGDVCDLLPDADLPECRDDLKQMALKLLAREFILLVGEPKETA